MPLLPRCSRFRLRPTAEQEHLFVQWAGCRRLVWNYFRERRQQHYRETGKSLSFAAMCKELTALKQQPEFAFLCDCDSQALQQTLRDLCSAYTNFFEGRARFPRRKSRKRTPHSFRIPQRVRLEQDVVSIPKAGLVPALLHRPVEGEVKSATIQQEPSGKWAITLVCHVEVPEPNDAPPQSSVGLDAGLDSFLTTSAGEKVASPRFYRQQERKLARAQRALARKHKRSRNRQKARQRVAKVHQRIRNQRNDWLHQQSRRLCDRHDCICIENLALSALTKTKLRGHSKAWLDAAWGEFSRQLRYKQTWKGHRLIAVSRWFPSSQRCHVCRERTRLDLSVRQWTCPCCDTEHDRDHNAAINIEVEGLRILAGGNPESQNVCGAAVRLPTRKQAARKQKSSGCEVGSTGL